MKVALIILFCALLSISHFAQTPEDFNLARIKQLASEEKWDEVIRIAEGEVAASAEVLYYLGIALARSERWEEAGEALERGRAESPLDKRFPIELAGIRFRQKQYGKAAGFLHRALRIDPEDKYANDFLGSVYFLQGNLEAALKYWNRVSKPYVEQVGLDPAPKVDQVLLDRAFALAPASVLQLSELRTTEARVGGMGIFPLRKFDLEARSGGNFDLVFRARERNGWGANKWQGMLTLFRGLPFQTVYPEYYNLGGRAINAVSLVRWDSEKRRVWANLSGPFSGDPKRRYYFDTDLRSEKWEIRDFSSSAGQSERLNLKKKAFSVGVASFESGRWSWSTGAEMSHRKFPVISGASAFGPRLLAEGFQLKHVSQLNYALVRLPERRFTVEGSVNTQIGRIWSEPSGTFAKLQGALTTHWFPQSTGNDYEMLWKVRGGGTIGDIPFDELFILGVERDNDLWLRAHSGTRNGRKGNAPMGRNYLLSNWEMDKIVFNRSLIDLKLGPFLDIGRITDPSDRLGSREWLWDLGFQAKVGVLGQKVRFSYGRDLQSGGDVFYITFR